MNKIVAKCESHSVDISGLHKVVDFIYEQALNSSEIIIQNVCRNQRFNFPIFL